MRRRLPQRAARQHLFVAEGLLVVNQHNVHPPAAQFPVLKAVVEQQRVAAEFFNRVTAAFHAVFVHQHHHVLEVRREHVRLIAGSFGIEQKRLAIGHHPRRRAVPAQQKSVDQSFGQRGRLGAVAAREDGHGAALVAEFTGEFFHDRRFAGAADRQIADGDDLHPQGGVAENADVVKEAAGLDEDLKYFRKREQRNPKHGGPLAAALFKDDFEDEGFNRFGPGSEAFAHLE